MRKKDYKTRQNVMRDLGQSVETFLKRNGMTKRVAAFMLVGTLILTMTPLTASGDITDDVNGITEDTEGTGTETNTIVSEDSSLTETDVTLDETIPELSAEQEVIGGEDLAVVETVKTTVAEISAEGGYEEEPSEDEIIDETDTAPADEEADDASEGDGEYGIMAISDENLDETDGIRILSNHAHSWTITCGNSDTLTATCSGEDDCTVSSGRVTIKLEEDTSTGGYIVTNGFATQLEAGVTVTTEDLSYDKEATSVADFASDATGSTDYPTEDGKHTVKVLVTINGENVSSGAGTYLLQKDFTVDTWIHATTGVEIRDAINGADTNGKETKIKLTSTQYTSHNFGFSLTIKSGANVTIDLNSHRIYTYKTDSVDSITVEKGATLTIMDSSEAANGWIVANQEKAKNAIKNYGTLIVNGGNLGDCPATGGYFGWGRIENYDDDGKSTSVTINGGTLGTVKDTSPATVTFEEPAIVINGGTFQTWKYPLVSVNHQNKAITVKGGNFWALDDDNTYIGTSSLTSFLAEGYSFVQSNGYVTVQKATLGTDQLYNALTGNAESKNTFDVQVGNWGYNINSTYGLTYMGVAARDDAINGHKMTLLRNISDTEDNNYCYLEYDVNYPNEEIVIDLNGHTWTHIATTEQAKETKHGWTAIFIWVENAGTGSCNVTVQNGTINVVASENGAENGAIGISNNGSPGWTGQNITLNNLNVNVAVDGGVGVYVPSRYSSCVITDCNITSKGTAVETRGSNVTINETSSGKTSLTSLGTEKAWSEPYNNGATTRNAALAVAQYNYDGAINVEINGGTFTGAAALLESDPQDTATGNNKPKDLISIVINAGTFNGAVYSQDDVLKINAGTFSGSTYKELNTKKCELTSTLHTAKDAHNQLWGDDLFAEGLATKNYLADNKILVLNADESYYKVVDKSAIYETYNGYQQNAYTKAYEPLSNFDVLVGADLYRISGDADAASAAVAAAANGTLKLRKNVTISDTIAIGTEQSVTIDLNGYTISKTSGEGAVIKNNGTLTITDSSTDGKGAIKNTSTAQSSEDAVILCASGSSTTIEGGTISGSAYAVKTETGANALTITGGTITGSTYALMAEADTILSIQGGTLNGKISAANQTGFAEKGSFNQAVTEKYIASGYVCVLDSATKRYQLVDAASLTVTTMLQENAEGKVADNSGTISTSTMSENQIKAITESSSNITVSGKGVENIVASENAGNQELSKSETNTLTTAKESAAKELNELNETSGDDVVQADDLNIIEKVYTEATVKEYSRDGYVVDITPYKQSYATKADTLDKIVTKTDAKNDTNKTANAIEIGKTKLTVTESVDMTIQIPVLTQDNGKEPSTLDFSKEIVVKHETKKGDFYYSTDVTQEQKDSQTTAYNISFTNPDGFSTFTVMNSSSSADVTFGSDSETTKLKITNVNRALETATQTGNTFSGWIFYAVTTGADGSKTEKALTSAIKVLDMTSYEALVDALKEENTSIIIAKAIFDPIKTSSDSSTNSSSSSDQNAGDAITGADSVEAANAAQTADAANNTGNTADTAANAGTGNASQNGTRKSTQNQIVADTDAEEVVEEEEQEAQIEESVVTEEVAQVGGDDLTTDGADGGVIVETVGNSSSAWIWLLVVLTCAAGAFLLIVVFKRRKEEEE